MMNVQAILKLHFLTRNVPSANLTPGPDEAFQLQEQFSGPVPLRAERPAAECLAERLVESNPAGTCPVFIP
jgi:hypothetical protein